ncbi:UDP-N-acetylglucosamine--N-acetylmuramyl-(pentapeptide) pyrophosphoryl-undecaprenol N-acetylglucosamine transferase [Mycetocola reblochoni]|uniref:UDP-N-acetylglucosamine--N-acetylmuramyl-(pentapeptide) pyrophosphoryl-undecaprenol N-acetylglucosamine transferase n=2 Tax=Mycetocola reblochoni TaxID=331618 RepID=A0A1R4J742_9MICO|nr:UDP-N-acetylglucosamine--N-acetylmuramyl-(pentapeptide) pyrophosphoryl-undecaprenol N-acetylglucosamine transferase [Mycetocola reblochoni]RLP69625.1 UDP-N-acetylglucosamine--N-acetylmuramyl-(pentapeptide) pyrophosphoryl-undecaprenol N-acetylglucosamine transferase [Mycetocola reblochoni]SJN27734.1 UDP-N-acetylglucosamine--N-acetylmuramyl-(pentapeptide) pyrophosphoryl-undecaprenol N-acetylglucosamine transferase [Mycetocola reblochoni REB411]
MTRYLLAGGGTAGHVNPLLATADELMRREPGAEVVVLGTAEGLEARLVPERGYELATIPKLPFPRRLNGDALRFPGRYRRAVATVSALIRDRGIDAVAGFGGYAAVPAYAAAKRTGVPLSIHEANAKPGLGNKLGQRYTPFVGVAFRGTPLRNARFVGMPLRPEITGLDRASVRGEAAAAFGLDPSRPVVLVTGGSLGARSVNSTVFTGRGDLMAAGYQVLHIVGGRSDIRQPEGDDDYRVLSYCDRMDLALALADLVISRAGASTVSELSALGIPAVYIPYPVGNGEQRFNAAESVAAGGAVLVDDANFTPEWLRGTVVPMLTDPDRLRVMGERAASTGTRHGSELMADLIADSIAGR